MPSSWLSPLSSATRRSSWFEVNAPQQSATPAPGPQSNVQPQQGNINLYDRPRVPNNGGVSTVFSMSFSERPGGPEILVPRVSDDGRILSPEEAQAQYYRTGRHLGIFATIEEADRYAQSLHEGFAAGRYDVPAPEMNAAWVDDLAAPATPDAPTSGAPAWLAPLGQTTPQAAPVAPGAPSAPGPVGQATPPPGRASEAPAQAPVPMTFATVNGVPVESGGAPTSPQAPAWLETLNTVLDSPVRAALRALPSAASVLADTWKVGLGIDSRRSVMREAEQLGNVFTAPQVGLMAGATALQEGASPRETVQRALRAAGEQLQGIPGETPSAWYRRSIGESLFPNLPDPVADLATDVEVDPLNFLDAFKGVGMLFGMAPVFVRRTERLAETARAARMATQSAYAAGRRVIEIPSKLVDPAWTTEFVQAARAGGWDDQVIASTADTIAAVARVFEAHPGLFPQEGIRYTSGKQAGELVPTWKTNGEYKHTVDVDQTCARVRKYWQTVESVERQVRRPLRSNELLALGQEMRAAGDIPGCIFCYVEAARRSRQEAAWKFATLTRDEAAANYQEGAMLEWMTRRDALLDQAGWTLDDYASAVSAPERRDAALAQGGPAAAAVQLFEDWKRTVKATSVTGHSTYNHEILNASDALLEELNARAGIRWWSSTDLDPTQLVESLKALADADLRRSGAHAFTKEPYAVEIFGRTGMKMNLSVAVRRDPATGKYISDDYNGMPLEVAKRLRKQYDQAGTMLVGKDLDQILWGLDSPDIDMIIPHHSGNWEGGVETYGVFGLDNFSTAQHEHWVWPGRQGQSVKAFAGEKLNFKYWLTQAKHDPRKAADLYLAWCRKNGIQPKFSGGTYQDHETMTTRVLPDLTQHPNYYKVLTDYARPETPQRAVDATRVNRAKMSEYLDAFIEGKGWTERERPDPETVTRLVDLVGAGTANRTGAALAAREATLNAPETPTPANLISPDLLRQRGRAVTGERPRTPAPAAPTAPLPPDALLVAGGSAGKNVPYARAGAPAPTLKANGEREPLRVVSGNTVRRVTPRGRARLMGLDDSYPLPEDTRLANTILGNGVPPPLARAVIGPILPKKGVAGRKLRGFSLFSGGGLVEAGVKDKVQFIGGVEFDPRIALWHTRAHGTPIEAADVAKVDYRRWAGEVDYLHASPVCKQFSVANAGRAEIASDLASAKATARAIREIRPSVVTIENVPQYRDSASLRVILDELTAQGFRYDMGVYDAAEYGTPQHRARLIVRAVKGDAPLPLPQKQASVGWERALEGLDLPEDTLAPWQADRLGARGVTLGDALPVSRRKATSRTP